MKSDIVSIDNSGKGFHSATDQAKKVAVYKGMSELDAIQLQVLTEEMLSLALSITGGLDASFWIEFEGPQAELHLNTKAVLDREQREKFIASSTSHKNEPSKTFLGRLRDMFEEAMTADPYHYQPDNDVIKDLPQGVYGESEWDGYEQSILKTLADDIKIDIHGDTVGIIVSKRFNIQD